MNQTTINPQRGEIWLVNFQPQIGDEMSKARPALVLSANGITRLQLRIIIPITDWKEAYTLNLTKRPLTTLAKPGRTRRSSSRTLTASPKPSG